MATERIELQPWEIKAYVLSKVKVGSTIMAQADRYNTDGDNGKRTGRTVTGISNYCIYTKDELNRPESFTFFDAFVLLREMEQKEKEEKEKENETQTDISNTAAETAETKETTGDTEFQGSNQNQRQGGKEK